MVLAFVELVTKHGLSIFAENCASVAQTY